jgi:hypothetical protein
VAVAVSPMLPLRVDGAPPVRRGAPALGSPPPLMGELVAISLRFPTVVFTVAVLVATAYWVVSSVGLFGLDLDTDLDLDGADGGGGGGVLDVLGLATVPPAVALSLAAIFGWFASLVASVVLDGMALAGAVAALAGAAAGLVALVVGLVAASLAARPLARFYVSERAPGLADVVGRTCTVRTGHVDATFGQAEVADGTGTTLLVEVRCAEENALTRGDEALIFGFDAETGRFDVTPAPSMH